jgi:glycosyltransferase involved in cell wall biosynthesis
MNKPLPITPICSPRVAVVHEWFETYAGSERCVEQFLKLYPTAGVHALVDFLDERHRHIFNGCPVRTSFIQRLPWAKKSFRTYLPLMPIAIEQFDVGGYDVIISSNHAVAKGVVTRGDQLHISYVHTPIRYAWDMQHEYLREGKYFGIKGMLARMVLHYLRLWDRAAADRVDVFVANSKFVAQRIRKTYRRPARVIYPPVDVEKFAFQPRKENYYVTASRMVPYKKIDVLVAAFKLLPDRKFVVVGDGPEAAKIRKSAPANVEFAGYLEENRLQERIGQAKAFLFAAEEDFGIAPVEAQACGTPVIAFGRGGARETVIDGETGLFFDEQTPESVAEAVRRFEASQQHFQPEVIRQHAEQFSEERFRNEFAQLVEEEYDLFQRTDWDDQRPEKTRRRYPARALVEPGADTVNLSAPISLPR